MPTLREKCSRNPGGVCRPDDDGYCRHAYSPYCAEVTPGASTRYCGANSCLTYPAKLCYGCWLWLCFDCYLLHRKLRKWRDLLRRKGRDGLV